MLKDITLGRFYPSSSILNRLDPRSKLAGLLFYLITVFAAGNIVEILPSVVALVCLILISKVPVRYMFKGFKSIVVIVILTDVISIFAGKVPYQNVILVTFRITEVLLSSNLLTLTTKPRDIADGLEKSLGFLNKIKIPVHDFATMVAIAFRFIPILTSEADRLLEAQKARGADFTSRNLIKRAKSIVPLTVPLFVSAFKKADDLAVAMDSRLYGNGKTSRLHPLRYTDCDVYALIAVLLYVSATLFVPVIERLLCL